MEKFEILVEQMRKLKEGYEQAKQQRQHRLTIDLEQRVKLHAARMDRYGANGDLVELILEVQNQRYGNVGLSKIYLAGISEGHSDELLAIVRWKLRESNVIVLSIQKITRMKLGTIQPY